VSEDAIEAQTKLTEVFKHCFRRNPRKMSDDLLDSAYVDRQLEEVEEIIEGIIESRHWFAGVSACGSSETIRRRMIDLLNAYLRQFSDFATELPERLALEAKSAPDYVHISFEFDPGDVFQSLMEALEDAESARRKHLR
jgi:hypothetical protein